ncbi:MAG: MurR/RpiR family transcriptional regulator [Rhodoferax sp.]
MTPPSSPVPADPADHPHAAAQALLVAIRSEFGTLSRQLQQIARYVEQHRDQIGLDRIQDVAEHCGVQPSAVIRFAKRFGFSGYSEMQRIFRDGITQQLAPGRNYQARIRQVIDSAKGQLSSADIADEFIAGSIAGMQEFRRDLQGGSFDDAVALLVAAPAVWVLGARRSFAVASYLAYALQHTEKRVSLVSGLGGMFDGQVRGVQQDDVMLVVSFQPYAEESLQCARQAAARGARLIAITDSRMNPLAAMAHVTLVVFESSTFGFRSLTNTMCLAQSLFIALAYRTELLYNPGPTDPISAGRAGMDPTPLPQDSA